MNDKVSPRILLDKNPAVAGISTEKLNACELLGSLTSGSLNTDSKSIECDIGLSSKTDNGGGSTNDITVFVIFIKNSRDVNAPY